MLAAAALFGAAAAPAQEITLFQNQNFSGPQFSASNSIQNLDYTGFNDRASSVIIRGGSWQLCADAFFRGQCVTLNPGQYPSLAAMGLNNSVSSIRETGWSGGGGGGGGGGGPGWGGGGAGGAITLYDSPGLSGRSYTANGPMQQPGRRALQRSRGLRADQHGHLAAVRRFGLPEFVRGARSRPPRQPGRRHRSRQFDPSHRGQRRGRWWWGRRLDWRRRWRRLGRIRAGRDVRKSRLLGPLLRDQQ